MAKTVIDRCPRRSIRLDDETLTALKLAAASHGSVNKLLRAMFVIRPAESVNKLLRAMSVTPADHSLADEEKRRVVYGDGSGHIGVIEALPPSRTFEASETTKVHVHGRINDLKYEPVEE